MKKKRRHTVLSLREKYPPSPPCSCEICRSYCRRPGWWTVEEAARALDAGHGGRMMLELSPDGTFGVLSPAFFGCEGGYALQEYSGFGCNFLSGGRCQLHGTGFQPLECRFCHHDRVGMGIKCHRDLERDWNTKTGQELVAQWKKLIHERNRSPVLL